MAKLSLDQEVATQHPRETLTVAGNIAALNSEVVLKSDSAGSVSLDLRGTFVLTVEVSGTVDGVNWIVIPMRPVNTASRLYVVSMSAPGAWMGSCGAYKRVRARCIAYTSGSATTTVLASNAPMDQSIDGQVTSALGTAVGASGASVVLTLAAAGAGLRHYLTYITIERFSAALLVASGTPTTITTTNLPGSLAFSIASDAALLGSSTARQQDFAYPLVSSAQNAATTITAPATAGVIWRITAGYYIAP